MITTYTKVKLVAVNARRAQIKPGSVGSRSRRWSPGSSPVAAGSHLPLRPPCGDVAPWPKTPRARPLDAAPKPHTSGFSRNCQASGLGYILVMEVSNGNNKAIRYKTAACPIMRPQEYVGRSNSWNVATLRFRGPHFGVPIHPCIIWGLHIPGTCFVGFSNSV